MQASDIELLFIAIASFAIAFSQYRKSQSSYQRLVSGATNEATCLDLALLITGFALLFAAVALSLIEYAQNGPTVAVLFVGFKWALVAIVVKEAKSIHRAVRPLLGK